MVHTERMTEDGVEVDVEGECRRVLTKSGDLNGRGIWTLEEQGQRLTNNGQKVTR